MAERRHARFCRRFPLLPLFPRPPVLFELLRRIEDELHRSLIVGALKEIIGDTVDGGGVDTVGMTPASGGEASNGDAAAAG